VLIGELRTHWSLKLELTCKVVTVECVVAECDSNKQAWRGTEAAGSAGQHHTIMRFICFCCK